MQRDAVAMIIKAGGEVKYDWEWSNGALIRGGKPWVPKWLVAFIGVDSFGHVTSVDLSSRATDASMAQVGRLTRVRSLQINSWAVTDDGLAHLDGLTGLSEVLLFKAQVTDAGLIHLNGLTNLSKTAPMKRRFPMRGFSI